MTLARMDALCTVTHTQSPSGVAHSAPRLGCVSRLLGAEVLIFGNSKREGQLLGDSTGMLTNSHATTSHSFLKVLFLIEKCLFYEFMGWDVKS